MVRERCGHKRRIFARISAEESACGAEVEPTATQGRPSVGVPMLPQKEGSTNVLLDGTLQGGTFDFSGMCRACWVGKTTSRTKHPRKRRRIRDAAFVACAGKREIHADVYRFESSYPLCTRPYPLHPQRGPQVESQDIGLFVVPCLVFDVQSAHASENVG